MLREDDVHTWAAQDAKEDNARAWSALWKQTAKCYFGLYQAIAPAYWALHRRANRHRVVQQLNMSWVEIVKLRASLRTCLCECFEKSSDPSDHAGFCTYRQELEREDEE